MDNKNIFSKVGSNKIKIPKVIIGSAPEEVESTQEENYMNDLNNGNEVVSQKIIEVPVFLTQEGINNVVFQHEQRLAHIEQLLLESSQGE